MSVKIGTGTVCPDSAWSAVMALTGPPSGHVRHLSGPGSSVVWARKDLSKGGLDMDTRFFKGVPGAALALALVAGGCKARSETASTRDTTTTGAVAATDTTANAPSTAPSSKLTDANIVALLDEANKADSTASASAAAKATSTGRK